MSLNVLVTGANRGIGLEFTRQLLERGDRVIAACRQPGRAHALDELAGEHPGRLQLVPLDVSDVASHRALLGELPLLLGEGGRLDLVIHNAGVLPSGERLGQLKEAVLIDALKTNATGPLLLSQSLAPHLADGAKIAHLSSVLGSITATDAFSTPSYRISKAAQNMATRLLAPALRDRGITVLALHPGWVQTEMGGSGAQVTPGDSARGLLKVIDGATLADSGGFIDWQGKPIEW